MSVCAVLMRYLGFRMGGGGRMGEEMMRSVGGVTTGHLSLRLANG